MRIVDPILRRLATPRDARLLAEDPGKILRLRVIARISLRYFWIYAMVIVVAAVATVASGYDIYHTTESAEFCASCHTMLDSVAGDFGKWKAPLHKSLECASCHVRPGMEGWMEAKWGGMRQAFHHVKADITGEDLKPKMTDDQKDITSENCQRCHEGATRLRERGGLVIAHNRHVGIGLLCIKCHDKGFAHPESVGGLPEPILARKSQCIGCHNTDAAAFRADSDKNCTRCHVDAGIGNRHGGARFDCTDCHEEGEEGAHYPLPTEDIGEAICENCHDIERGYASTHGAFEKGLCLECHNVMSPSHLYVTGSRPTAIACLVCHDEMAEVLGDIHGVRLSRFADGDRDLHRFHQSQVGEDQLWCLSCHAPHGSDATVAQIQLKGTFQVAPEGGSCSGDCHGEETVSYDRRKGDGK
jgi:nitrate/TMAO reductase-like tetraheme cytochrome c subunit